MNKATFWQAKSIKGQRASREPHHDKGIIDAMWRRGGSRGPQRGKLARIFARVGGIVFR